MTNRMTRRDLIKATSALGGSALVAHLFGPLARVAAAPQQPQDALAAARQQMGGAPIEAVTLTDTLTMLSGPGGNVVVLHGPDGKVVVDTFVQPAWPRLRERIEAMGTAPIAVVIDTHWHFDHTDNNERFRAAGARILAHENTRTRLSEPHDLLGMHFEPAPAAALPTETFAETQELEIGGERVTLGYIPPAHTDTDVYIRFTDANVLHLGDVFFNGMYPFIDASTGGNITGMIDGAGLGLKMADSATRIVPGHGPVGDAAALTAYRDMLVTVRDRVRKLKTAGESLEQVLAGNPTADLDATWGKGFMQPDDFVAIVYNTV